NDLVIEAVSADLAAENRGVGVETGAPQFVGQNGDSPSALLHIFPLEIAAYAGADSQHGEEVCGRGCAGNFSGRTAGALHVLAQGEGCLAPQRHVLEGAAVLPPAEK